MKTLNRYKSLLLAGGLLIICLKGEPRHFPRQDMPRTVYAISRPKAIHYTSAMTAIRELAGKLFPVLKNLNLM